MALVEIPTSTDGTPHYEQRTKLDGVDYVFNFRFSERRGAWSFDLHTLDGDEIISGQTVTVGRDLLRRSTAPQKPPGTLFVFRLDGTRDLPGLYDFGEGGPARLYYQESSE